jgi:hypothetical protein
VETEWTKVTLLVMAQQLLPDLSPKVILDEQLEEKLDGLQRTFINELTLNTNLQALLSGLYLCNGSFCGGSLIDEH